MSHKADKLRAQSGTIFRDGQLRSRDEWYDQHPTREVQVAKQEQVDKATAALLEEKFKDKPYQCSKCGREHRPGTAVYGKHKELANV